MFEGEDSFSSTFSIRFLHGKLNFNFFGWNILLAKSINYSLIKLILHDTVLTIKAT